MGTGTVAMPGQLTLEEAWARAARRGPGGEASGGPLGERNLEIETAVQPGGSAGLPLVPVALGSLLDERDVGIEAAMRPGGARVRRSPSWPRCPPRSSSPPRPSPPPSVSLR